jgi:hypothetical protein
LQEEVALCCLVACAISLLLLSLRPSNAADYVYAALFLTCASAVLKLRWFVGTAALAVPVLLAISTNLRVRLPAAAVACAEVVIDGAANRLLGGGDTCEARSAPAAATLGFVELLTSGPLPLEALVHILVAWAVGALMAYVSGEERSTIAAWARM